MTEGPADKPQPTARTRWMRRLRIAGLCAMLLAALLVLGAVIAWQNRTDLLAWGVRTYLEGGDVKKVSLDVVAVEPDHLYIRDLRVDGARKTAIRSIQAKYDFVRFIGGTIDGLTLTGIQSTGDGPPIEIDTIKGAGKFDFDFLHLDRLNAGLDLVRMRIGPQNFDPSRIDIDFHDNKLVVDTAFTSPDGYVTVLGSGKVDAPGTPFHLLLSGHLNAALAAAPLADHVDADGHIAFSLSAQMNDPLFFLTHHGSGTLDLPKDFTLDGDVRLALDRLRVNGVSLPVAAPDRFKFRLESRLESGDHASGKFTTTLNLSKRDTPDFGFTMADAELAGSYVLDGHALALKFVGGPFLKLRELRLSKGLPVPGDMALQLLGGTNEVDIDLDKGTLRHVVDSQLSWKSGELSLKSEGHLTDPEDPVIFTLRGAFDATPLLGLSPATKSATGHANLFFAGRVSQPLLLDPAMRPSDEPWPGDIRLDGAIKVDTTGLKIPGATAEPKAKDSIEVTLRSFNGSSGHQSGRLAVNATFDPRRFGELRLDQTKVALDGRLTVGTRGYQFIPGIESVVNIKSLRTDAGLVVPGGLNFQLTGSENYITVPTDFSAVYHEITFAHLEADGYMLSGKKKRPFRVTVPKISSREVENGKLALYLTGGSFELPADHLAGRDVNASLEQTAAGTDFHVEAGEIRQEVRPPVTAPLALSGKGTIRGDKLHATLSLRERYGPLKIDGVLKHNLKTQAGQLDFTVPKLVFGDKKAALDDIFPAVAGWFSVARGAASAQGHILWDHDLHSGEMAVALDNLDIATQNVQFADLNGTVNFIELMPLSMPPRQRLRGTVSTGKLGPWPMQLEFQLRDDGKIDIQDFDIAMAGGVVRARALIDPKTQGAADGAVLVRSVDIHELLELLGVNGLQGSGKISGTVPIRVRDGRVIVANGTLKAEGPGQLSYKGTALQEQLAGRPDTVGTVAQVLSDFHYTKLRMELTKNADGAGVIVLHMDGSNPKTLNGHPFSFNIKIESDFNKLAYLAQGGMQTLTDVIREADRQEKRK